MLKEGVDFKSTGQGNNTMVHGHGSRLGASKVVSTLTISLHSLLEHSNYLETAWIVYLKSAIN